MSTAVSDSTDDLPQVDKTTFGEKDDVATRRHRVAVNLRLYVHDRLCVCLEPCNVEFNVKVPDATTILAISLTLAARNHRLANDSILGHHQKVLRGDNVTVTGGSHKNVGAWRSILHGGDFVTCHSSLESIDGVDLRDQYTSTVRAK